MVRSSARDAAEHLFASAGLDRSAAGRERERPRPFGRGLAVVVLDAVDVHRVGTVEMVGETL